jgi:glycosyltransferase involved in cell wall biosynthesis
MHDARRLLIASQPLDSGVPRQVFDLVTSLDAAHYEVEVACPRASTLWADLDGRDGVRLYEIAPHRGPALADVGTLLQLLRLVAHADVIHAHSAKAGFLARLAAALRGRRSACVFTPHAWSFWAADGFRGRLYRNLERVAARWCRMILVVSEQERLAGLAAGIGRPEQYRVVTNGIELERFSAPPDPVDGRVVFLGRLSRQKRPDVAVRALARLLENHPAAELHIAGEGPERAPVKRLAERLGVTDALRMLGTREDIPELLSGASCLLLTSDYEGCPLSVLEAMAAGVPVVATRVGAVPEMIDDDRAGLLVEPGDAEGAAAAIGELLADPAHARELGDEGRRRARERFSREQMIERTLALYDEVAAGASSLA